MTNKNQDINKIITQHNVLFFDLDGTLVDTEYANYLSYKMAYQTVMKKEDFILFNPNKRFNRTVLKKEYPNLNEKDYLEIIKLKETLYEKNLNNTRLIQPVNEILNMFFGKNIIVLVTNCRKNRALLTLKYHGLTPKFNYIFFKELIEKDNFTNKFEYALKKLKIDRQNVIVFENEANQINHALEAGIPIENILNF